MRVDCSTILALKNIEGFTFVHEFVSALKIVEPAKVSQINEVLAKENIADILLSRDYVLENTRTMKR